MKKVLKEKRREKMRESTNLEGIMVICYTANRGKFNLLPSDS